ncbi:MAG TPA: glyoxylate/hydroxypyruvate reductase A [Gammaproteobacteria bacterium]|nr:glyoxylate/hydroxypyruvate reductase A [Gammaproteobacteria bacterium]
MTMMIISERSDAWAESWVKAIHAVDPNIKINIWPDIEDPLSIAFAVAWVYPHGELAKFPNLKCISSAGAGVDFILSDPKLPKDLAVVRLIDKNLIRDMTQYIVWAVLNHARHFDFYSQSQTRKLWAPRSLTQQPKIGIMGSGQLGSDAAIKLTQLGFQVSTFSQSPQTLPDITHFYGKNQLNAFLSRINILICLLPLTPDTRHILNRELFGQLPPGAYLINVARGHHLVEADLIAAIESNQLSGACLDVFATEPLPTSSPLWKEAHVIITPHIASTTDTHSVAPQIVENYRRVMAGQPLLNLVNREKGY